jgi:ribonuclease-3
VNDAENWCKEVLNYQFSDSGLLTRALTHRSASSDHNERLEFLGDAVLDLSISRLLYDVKPNVREGGLSRFRSELVRKESLVELATGSDMAPHIILGSGEQRSGGRQRDSVLANALEAILGAILLDGGYEAANRVILDLFAERLASLPDEEQLKDAKTRLQEYLQARQLPPPEYEMLDVSGAAHAQTFEVTCRIPDLDMTTTDIGSSRRRAEQAAAERALDELAGD